MLVSVTFGMTKSPWYRELLVGAYTITVVMMLLTTVTLWIGARIE
jgi:hypothetical protein